ncbi:pro-neuregulin-1, membrane-bound isoform-like isoform X2 [Dreissena polymorpha]|uniref:pro-neuregulin-1, membrane-bound isoform-like isoform X2 n=1 Tax=Dreissena polymorpha TaxID=45954 RepID=UPI0022652DAA|nr:pro-neuregulin-1, membrane-bound isoform-like isoform X2 [Dreissena polymorpha]
MRLFRLRFILLGLLLCLDYIWCLNCGTDFVDPASSAYQADVVVIAKLMQKLPPIENRYNTTINVKGKRNIVKGHDLLKRLRLLTIGELGTGEVGRCVFNIAKETSAKTDFIFFLRQTNDDNFFRISAEPVPSSNKKMFKQAKKDIKKILCDKEPCAKPPEFHLKKKMKDATIAEGENIELTCTLKTRPFPAAETKWLKDGVLIEKNIQTGKKSSRLRIRKAGASDSGTYTCVVRNVGGEKRQTAVITVSRDSPPQLSKVTLDDVKVKFQTPLRLTCKVKDSPSNVRFTWFKDGKEIDSNSRPGIEIDTRKTESRLRKNVTLLNDQGLYTCVATNAAGELVQKSNVTVTDVSQDLVSRAPAKIIECTEAEKSKCLNNATCQKYAEINQPFCTCQNNYQGTRCNVFVPSLTRKNEGDDKLAKDRTFVVVGIVSGIILFITICVVSYFLARRRRHRYLRRRGRQCTNGIADKDIPDNGEHGPRRPLIFCDDINGPMKSTLTTPVEKEVQTTETCFLSSSSDNTNLYINPNEGYVSDRSSRSRKDAISEGDSKPRPVESDQTSDDENIRPKNSRNSDPNFRKPLNGNTSTGRARENELNKDGAPSEPLNDLSPKRKSFPNENAKPILSKPSLPNIPNPRSSQGHAINIDSDSDEELPRNESPLTPLHISEDEGNGNYSSIFKKCRTTKPGTSSATNITQYDSIDAHREDLSAPVSFLNENLKEVNKRPDAAHDHSETVADKPRGGDMEGRPRKAERHRQLPAAERSKHAPSETNGKHTGPTGRPRSGPQQHRAKDKERERRRMPVPPEKQRPPSQPDRNRSIAVPTEHIQFPSSTNVVNPKTEFNDRRLDKPSLLLQSDGNLATPDVTEPRDDVSDSSSTTTEGCDSPNTVWQNAQLADFADVSPVTVDERQSNRGERAGSADGPKSKSGNAADSFSIFPKMPPRANAAENNRNFNQRPHPNELGRTKLKDKFSIAI